MATSKARRTRSSTRGDSFEIPEGPLGVRLVAGKVRSRMLERGLTYTKVAEQAGLHPRTVARIVEGDTLYPYHRTVLGLLRAIGYRLVAVS